MLKVAKSQTQLSFSYHIHEIKGRNYSRKYGNLLCSTVFSLVLRQDEREMKIVFDIQPPLFVIFAV